MVPTYRPIRSGADADALRAAIETIYDGWYARQPRIDWEDFLARLEWHAGVDLGERAASPAIRRIKAIVRELRRER